VDPVERVPTFMELFMARVQVREDVAASYGPHHWDSGWPAGIPGMDEPGGVWKEHAN